MSYKRLDPDDLLISAESVTTSCWSNNVITLDSFFTSSIQVNSTSGDYYYAVYNTASELDTSVSQFAIGFAHKLGSGSLLFNDSVEGKSSTSTVYGQYRTLLLGDEESDFKFNGISSDYFYIINIDRSRYKEKLLPGSLELKLSGSSEIILTDNSATTSTVTFTDAGRVYELKANVSSSVANSGSYGKIFPDVGIILLNGQALDAATSDGGINLGTQLNSDQNDYNTRKLFNSLANGGSFKLRSEETISSNFVFIRARNSEFNYTTNPSMITGSGEIRFNNIIDSPQTYITSVGLYNDNNDLLAVAKLSRPLLKDSTKEALLRIKLNY